MSVLWSSVVIGSFCENQVSLGLFQRFKFVRFFHFLSTYSLKFTFKNFKHENFCKSSGFWTFNFILEPTSRCDYYTAWLPCTSLRNYHENSQFGSSQNCSYTSHYRRRHFKDTSFDDRFLSRIASKDFPDRVTSGFIADEKACTSLWTISS